MSMRYMSVLGAVVLGLLLAGTLDAAPYQELEPREGYVPVYIREGDTPLLEINPKLAEAFNEIDTQNLLEVDDNPESEKKPDLILLSVDNGDAMLIAQSEEDQVMSEDEPVEVIAIVPAPSSENQEEKSDIAEIPQANPIDTDEEVDKAEEGESPQAETSSQQLEEAREAIKELVNVLEVEMLEKLSLAVTEQPVVDVEKNAEEAKPQAGENEEPKIGEQEKEEEEEKEVVPEQPSADDDDSNHDDRKIIEDDKPQEQATDVSTVDAFKTKEIDVKSIETEKIDVPEEESPDTVSTDE